MQTIPHQKIDSLIEEFDMIETIPINASFIPLTQNQIAIIDLEDYDRVNEFKWQAAWDKTVKHTKRFYAIRERLVKESKSPKTIRMHRFILNAQKGTIVDHINGNGLDNRKSNLRFVSPNVNSVNRHDFDYKSSKYQGVSWHKESKLWFSRITINKKTYSLGYFKSEEDAAKAYQNALKNYNLV